MKMLIAFLSAALPLVLSGIALAVLAVNCGTKKRCSRVNGTNIAMGACLGLLLGVSLDSCGLWENHAIGLALGPLWGMALGAAFKGTEPPCSKNGKKTTGDRVHRKEKRFKKSDSINR